MCIGFSTPILADNLQLDFDASQFKLDLILAKRGDADAQYYVGNAYEEGRGTQKDLKQAFKWYGKAAAQKQHDAQFKLAYFYEHGLGVKKDMNKAMEWQKRAAKNNNSVFRDRMNKQAFSDQAEKKKLSLAAMKIAKEKREQERRQAEALAKKRAERLRQQQLAVARQKRIEMAAMHKPRPVAIKRVNIPDISDVVLNNKWHSGSQPADFLPSSSTHCLRSSSSEIVCFSGQKQRTINGMRVTYTTKATLNAFKPDGTFHIKYNYNAATLAKASDQGIATDPHGLKLEKGWQEPTLDMNCRTIDRLNLYCARGYAKFHYQH